MEKNNNKVGAYLRYMSLTLFIHGVMLVAGFLDPLLQIGNVVLTPCPVIRQIANTIEIRRI